jgi:rare lipoprotein A
MKRMKRLAAVFPEPLKACTLFILAFSIINAQAAAASDSATGKATVYSNSFSGKKTASGDRFNQQAPTAASNKFPLGSKVKVKNLKTGKQATVKITDRTSKRASAQVDLSQSTAQKLGVKGTAPVKADLVSKPPKK